MHLGKLIISALLMVTSFTAAQAYTVVPLPVRYKLGMHLLKQGKALINGTEHRIRKQMQDLASTTLQHQQEVKASMQDLQDIIRNGSPSLIHQGSAAHDVARNATGRLFTTTKTKLRPERFLSRIRSQTNDAAAAKRMFIPTMCCALLCLTTVLFQI